MSKEGRDTNRVVAILIENPKGNILLGKRRDNGKWANPGGSLKSGECYYDGCRRELLEETGLDAQEMKLVKVCKIDNLFIYLLKVTVDPSQPIDSSKDPDQECENWEYKDPNDIKDEFCVPIKRNVLLKYWIEN